MAMPYLRDELERSVASQNAGDRVRDPLQPDGPFLLHAPAAQVPTAEVQSESPPARFESPPRPWTLEHAAGERRATGTENLPRNGGAVAALHRLLPSPELQQALLAALLGKPARRTVSIDGRDIPVSVFLRLFSRVCREAAEQCAARGLANQNGLWRDQPPFDRAAFEENEFRLDRLPAKAQQQFGKGPAAWRDAVLEAIRGGIRDPETLADLIFFARHPERMAAGTGKPISTSERAFVKLRAEWGLYRTIVIGLQAAPGAAPAGTVFLPANPSGNYEDYVAAPTTGRITLLINGRNQHGSGSNDDKSEPFDSMQEAVESLGHGDSIFITNWQFAPTLASLTKPRPDMKNWGDLLKSKAKSGVKIRVIISDLPTPQFQTNLTPIDKLIGDLPSAARDNFKYIFSKHPSLLSAHHQKLMIVRKGREVVAFCGGLDISFNRTRLDWKGNFVWHDIHAKLEGLIARDVEREFVLRWNREKDKSTAGKLPGWLDLEKLAQAPLDSIDRSAAKNVHKLQMLRTVSIGPDSHDLKRDDIWQGYFRLIASATRFLYLENQYFHEPAMADAIVMQAQARSDLIVIIVVSSRTDDPDNIYAEHCRALRSDFFTRLFAGVPSGRLRVYTMPNPLIHSKLALADDRFLSIGSANANPRGFFLDTELNVMFDDADAVKSFRHRLWAHDLGVAPGIVASWGVSDFIAQWDTVAKANESLRKTPDRMIGEGVIPFDPRSTKDTKSRFIPDVLC
jgi:phosphatidylserine/phosphatidylglycerophosphate/cardiolipin synthase-like enzyme